jgi:hypothetical protein
MVLKLEDWDRSLEEAQVLIENQMKSCNKNIIDNYER